MKALFCLLLLAATPAWAGSTTTALAITGNGAAVTSVQQGAVVTLTATVTPAVTGLVRFCDDPHCLGLHLLSTASLIHGAAAYKFRPGPGAHSYQAQFSGTTQNAASSSSSAALSVIAASPAPTITGLTTTGASGSYTLTATVGGQGSTAPSGTVSFLDTTNGNTVVGTAPLGPGTGFDFISSTYPTVGNSEVATGDFNGDGIPDIVIGIEPISTNGNPLSYLAVLLGNGDGTFTPTSTTYPTGLGSYSTTVGDFNQDGFLDLAVANDSGNNVTILLGHGDGTFTPSASAPSTQADPVSITAADFNDDGILDLAVANGSSNNVTILLGNGDGTFASAPLSPATGLGPDSIVPGDFNRDGIQDLAVANGTSSTVTLLLGHGDGTFTSISLPAGTASAAIAAADWNGDGILDLAAIHQGNNGSAGSVTILLGNGDGTFHPTSQSLATGVAPGSIVAGDFNGDGIPDLAIANQVDNSVTVLLGVGDGSFTSSPSNPATSIGPDSMAAADFTGDGLAGLAVADAGSYNGGSTYQGYGLTVLLPAAHVATASVAGFSPGFGPHSILASYPGDSTYTASTSAPFAINGPVQSTSLTLTANATSPVPYGQQVTLTATLAPFTVSGHSTDGQTITFSNGGTSVGTAMLMGGVATLTVPFTYSATYKASYAGDPAFSPSTSAPLALTGSAQATTLYLNAEPGTSLHYGQTVTFVATLSPFTASGHSTDGETVTFSSGQTAVLSGGIASVQLTFPGPSNITASYPGDANLSPSTSSPITLTAAPPVATTLAVSANPSTVMYGQMITYTATLTPGTVLGVNSSGTVTFLANGRYAAQATLSSGTASVTEVEPIYIDPAVPAAFPAGSYTLTAQYSGDGNFAPSEGQSPVPLVIEDIKTSVALTSSANPALVGSPVTFTAAITPGGINPLAGPVGVTFYDGTTQICAAAPGYNGGVATCTVSTLGAGSHSITAAYSGDNYELGSTSAALTETIQAFAFAPAGGGATTPSQTAAPGGQAAYALALTPPAGGFAAPVTFSVAGLPAGAIATFSPASLPAGSAATNVTMTVTIPAKPSARDNPLAPAAIPTALGLILLPFFGRKKNRLRRSILLPMLAIAFTTAAMTGCGGSSSYSGGSGGSGSGTPPPQSQTYNLTITATSQGQQQSIPATLIVQS